MEKLSVNELNALIGMLDIATKAGGLQVAQQSLPLALKLGQMAQFEAAAADAPAATVEQPAAADPVEQPAEENQAAA